MGHKSIIEHDYLVFGLCEVDFRTAGFYIPKFRNKDGKEIENQNELTTKYKEHMQYLFNSYGDIEDLRNTKRRC